ncbi:MAG: ABC transporter substrate-binding protein [Zoogloeaceae bacterium]|nr:ABC transporter substrate-binding protein [Zoogloeaceae bacterium]MCK6385025.1 ABC transporter substrate-binding protein [Rhodocyclaceae bacterium]
MKTGIKRILTAVVLLAGAVPFVPAQQADRSARVATLITTTPEAGRYAVEAFEAGLRERGWVPGRNLVIEHFHTDTRPELLPRRAAELLAWKPDVAVGFVDSGAIALKQLTDTVPIVVGIAKDPIASGLAESLARPGGNVTGMVGLAPVLVAKHLQLLRELLPRTRRIGVVWNTGFAGNRVQWAAAEKAASDLGLTLVDGGVEDAAGIAKVFERLARARIDALHVWSDNLTWLHRREIIAAAARYSWPAQYGFRQHCEEGGLICYSLNPDAQFRRSALFVDRILRGAAPATMPFEQPTTFDLVINLETARALGIAVPQSLLLSATRVIGQE